MDQQLARLVEAFERHARGPAAIIVAGDHGEGLGDRGESLHGNLLYQSTMHVPMVLVGPGMPAETVDRPVSTRRIFHTILDLAGIQAEGSLRTNWQDVVLGEAMKPFLEYGWLPQMMVVDGPLKGILAGRLESYDVINDPGETQDLGGGVSLSPVARKALEEYPVPSREASRPPENLSDEARRNLASLGYVAATAQPVVRKDAPRPVDMVHLFDAMERAAGLFVAERYAEAIPLFEKILAQDPHNLDAALRLATSYSSTGQRPRAQEAFRKASQIAPDSPDVRVYLALHYAQGTDSEQNEAAPVLEKILADNPDRLPVVEALARIRARQGRTADAIGLYQKAYASRAPTPAEAIRLAQLAMSAQQTPLAIEWFEKARSQQGPAFSHDVELGVVYLAARRLPEARDALDRVPASDPEYPMALFKRAQVSVLLNEPDSSARIAKARQHADATTRPLIAQERLFQPPSR
jgi:Tfp pilus assembly protein PilF